MEPSSPQSTYFRGVVRGVDDNGKLRWDRAQGRIQWVRGEPKPRFVAAASVLRTFWNDVLQGVYTRHAGEPLRLPSELSSSELEQLDTLASDLQRLTHEKELLEKRLAELTRERAETEAALVSLLRDK
ncbi:MAG TPA: hypothetical protein VEJ63_12280 [Planctomycetota bacterium]|nr:hypothetical protein [Planctomycetota bacterium]